MWEKIKSVRGLITGDKKDKDKIYENDDIEDLDKNTLKFDDTIRDMAANNNIMYHSQDSIHIIGNIASKANMVSFFNHPRKPSWMDEMLNVIQEHLDDIPDGNFTESKPIRTVKGNISIETTDFEFYMNKINKALDTYKKYNKPRIIQKANDAKIDLKENIIECYNQIPSIFFSENYVFNFENLNRNAVILTESLEKLGEHLDIVEMNLFYQITSKFKEFLDIIEKFNQMERQIDNSLKGIEFLRETNKMLKLKLNEPSSKILALKKRQINIERTLYLLDLMKLVQDTIPAMQNLIDNNNFNTAANLIKESDEIYTSTLRPIICLKNCKMNLRKGRETLENCFRKEFQDRCLAYVIQALAYCKEPVQDNSTNLSLSSSSSSSSGDSPLHERQIDYKHTELLENNPKNSGISSIFPWKFEKIMFDEKILQTAQLETLLAHIIIEHIKINQIKLADYRTTLIDILKGFNAQYNKDVQDYLDLHQSGKLSDLITKTSSELYIDFLYFYFEIFKRLISLHLTIIQKILEKIIEYYDNNFIDSKDNDVKNIFLNEYGESNKILDKSILIMLTDNIDEFYNIIAAIIRYFINQMIEMINKIRYDNISINEFHKFSALFDDIKQFFDDDVKLNQALNTGIKSDKPRIRAEINKLTANLLDKISIVSILKLKAQSEKNFIESHHKQRMATLVASLCQETWIPADIPEKFIEYLSVFFNDDSDMASSNNNNNDIEINPLAELYTENNGITHLTQNENNHESCRKETNMIQLNRNNNINITKKTIFINHKKYKLTSSFLILIQIIHDFLFLAKKYKVNGSLTIRKLFEIIKYYSSFTCQLILGAGAIPLGVIKSISAKIIALSALDLYLLIDILISMKRIILTSIDCNTDNIINELTIIQSDISNHRDELCSKIFQIIKERVEVSCNEIKKLDWQESNSNLNIPTKFTTQITNDTKNMYNQIEDFFMEEDLKTIFQKIIDDISQSHVFIFEKMEINTGTVAQRVYEELGYILKELKKIKIISKINFNSFEQRINLILQNKCRLNASISKEQLRSCNLNQIFTYTNFCKKMYYFNFSKNEQSALFYLYRIIHNAVAYKSMNKKSKQTIIDIYFLLMVQSLYTYYQYNYKKSIYLLSFKKSTNLQLEQLLTIQYNQLFLL